VSALSVAGRPVRLTLEDDAHDPAQAAAAFQTLRGAGVQAVIGPFTSAMATAVVPLANAAGLLVVSPTVTSMDFYGRDDHFFRLHRTTRDNARDYARVLAARVWPATDYTRLTIESDALVGLRLRPTGQALKLAVELENLEAHSLLTELAGKVRPDDPFIARLRVDTASGGSLLLRIDLKQPVRPQTFNLAPVAAYRHRAVIDLYAAVERDPLLGLIQEKQAAERQAQAAVQATRTPGDALGSFIEGLPPRTAAGGAGVADSTGAPGTAASFLPSRIS